MKLDIEKAFKYPLRDPKWLTKMLIGGVLSIIPIANFITWGYCVRIIKDTAEGSDEKLPEWQDMGAYFMQGLTLLAIYMIYYIPMIFMMVFTISSISSSGAFSIFTSGDLSEKTVLEGINVLNRAVPALISWLSSLYGLFFSIMLPAVLIAYVSTGDFKAAFNVGRIFNYMLSNIGTYLLFLLLALLAQLVAYAGLLACCVGIVFTLFYAYVFMSHLLGQMMPPPQAFADEMPLPPGVKD
ncbi:MAG: DUF4013 domain-containing protein [Candidatus Eremiobacteraeota bacterium]|nr:DUF4013 domain-containing protein [Candidatus Eremiobacteraeota bacterium]